MSQEPFRKFRPELASTLVVTSALCLTISAKAHAQNSLFSQVTINNVNTTASHGGFVSAGAPGQSAVAESNYGLVGGSGVNDSAINSAFLTTGAHGSFADTILVSSSSLALGAPITVTLSVSLNGSNSVFVPLSPTQTASASIQVGILETIGPVGGGGSLGQVQYNYQQKLTNNGAVAGYPVTSGGLSSIAVLANGTAYFFGGSIDVDTTAQGGGQASASYADTAVFNITSAVSDATFTGSQGTNYSTLTDPNAGQSAASAPEPASDALLLLPVGLGFLRRSARRRRCTKLS